jgi:hypothetical protein
MKWQVTVQNSFAFRLFAKYKLGDKWNTQTPTHLFDQLIN